jgi:hypothetical protein
MWTLLRPEGPTLQTITELPKLFKRKRRGISNVIVVMLSLVLIVIVVANVVMWSYQMNEVDWERGEEKIEITNVALSSSGETEVTIKNTGSLLAHIVAFWVSDSTVHQRVTADTFIDLGQTVTYTLTLGMSLNKAYTVKVVTERGNMAVFNGQFIASNGAMIVYGEGASSIPKYRTWNGVSWSSQENGAAASSTMQWVVLKSCPTRDEKILGVLSSAGYLDVSVWNGTSKTWSQSLRVASVGTVLPSYRPFDIAYEQESGRGVIVYNPSSTGTRPQYRIWNVSAWSQPQEIDNGTAGVVYWIKLASKTNSNEIAIVTLDASQGICGTIWNGTNWTNGLVLENAASTTFQEDIAVEYMQVSGNAMFAWGSGTFMYSRIWNGTGWESGLPGVNIGATCNWFSLKADPTSNGLVLVSTDSSASLNTIRWNGTNWILDTTHDGSLNTMATRCADAEFETSPGNEGHIVLVWGKSNLESITYQQFDGTAWSIATQVPTSVLPTTSQEWVVLRHDKYGKMLLACADDSGHINTAYWNGTYWIWTDQLEAQASTYNTPCFDLSPDAYYYNAG